MNGSELASAVMEAADRAAVAGAVGDLYQALGAEIELRRPVCVMSGRCCHFEEYGHRLYVTTMELATFVREHRTHSVPLQVNEGGCPFQKQKQCTVHSYRPMGCRLFFCDASSDQWQKEKYEEFHGQLKRLHEVLEVPYAYVEWRAGLAAVGLTR
jgi:Fe-S-cluster containining protein